MDQLFPVYEIKEFKKAVTIFGWIFPTGHMRLNETSVKMIHYRLSWLPFVSSLYLLHEIRIVFCINC